MGTNYYIVIQSEQCNACGHVSSEEIHIGKQSAGWPFCLSPWRSAWSEWKELILSSKGLIKDEYGGLFTADQMIAKVEATGRMPFPEGLFGDATDYRDFEGYRISRYYDFS